MVATMALASCSNESDNADSMTPVTEGHQTTLTFTAGMSYGAATRTAIDTENGLKLLFQNNDQILIQDYNLEVTDATATLPEGQKETSPTCSFTASFSDDTTGPYTAFYPQSAFSATPGELISAGTLKAEQEVTTAGTFDPEAHIMTATSVISQTCFLFQTRNAFLKFTAPFNLSMVKLQGYNGEKIAGNFTIESDGSIKAADNASSEVTLAGDMQEGNVYYIALIPTVFENGVTVTLTNFQDEEFTYRTEEPVTFLPNKVNTISAEKLQNLPHDAE